MVPDSKFEVRGSKFESNPEPGTLNLKPETSNFKLMLRAWPVIAIATIGLCFLTQLVAGWLGIELKEQANIELVRQMFRRAFESWKFFGIAALNTALILVICPVIEELIFRWGLYSLVLRLIRRCGVSPHAGETRRLPYIAAVVSSVLFSAAHYLQQPWPDNAFLALFFFGLAQCWLYRKTGKLWCAMLNHALFNLTNLVLMFFVS